jgi:hypothetical protein
MDLALSIKNSLSMIDKLTFFSMLSTRFWYLKKMTYIYNIFRVIIIIEIAYMYTGNPMELVKENQTPK